MRFQRGHSQDLLAQRLRQNEPSQPRNRPASTLRLKFLSLNRARESECVAISGTLH